MTLANAFRWKAAASWQCIGITSVVQQTWQHLVYDPKVSDPEQGHGWREQVASVPLDALSFWLGRAAFFKLRYKFVLEGSNIVPASIKDVVNAANQLGHLTCIAVFFRNPQHPSACNKSTCAVQAGFCMLRNERLITVHADSSTCALQESALRLDWTKLGHLRRWYIAVHPHGRSAGSASADVYRQILAKTIVSGLMLWKGGCGDTIKLIPSLTEHRHKV